MKDKHKISMLRYNAKVLCNNLKRKKAFSNMLKDNYDIIFFQKGHSTPEIENEWNREWPGLRIHNQW